MFQAAKGRRMNCMHLLLVEDEARLASAVRRVLEEEGHVVDWVDDGADAFAQAQTEEYDLILLDVMLPSLNGFDIAKRLRAKGNAAPILMLTAKDAVNDRVQGLDSGADDYLVKPFALAELLARVRALTRRARMGPAGDMLLKVGDLELDLKTREAVRGDKRIELTAKEFTLLEVMMRHPGQVMTRSQLLDRIWSYDVLTESNIVDIYIHYLRNKIDRDFDEKLIRTVRGVGYALRAN
jgi:DNA-binding response OmpR family regulator